MIPLKIFLIFSTSSVISLLVLPFLSSNISSKIGLLDYPNKRKVHNDPKPLIGGIGIIMALSISSLLFMPLSNLRGFYIGVIILGIIGFLDDFRELNHRLKFAVQIIASIFMIHLSGTTLLSFGDLLSFGPINLGILAVPMTIFCTVGVINAINMIDGLDGLAGGVSLVAFISFTILAYVNNQIELMLLSIALSGATLGFLKYNWRQAKLYMGDAGSFALGFSLAFLSIGITQKVDSVVPPVAPLLILTIPIVDTITIMIKRMINGKSPFQPDKYHLHHILLRLGLNNKSAVIVILLLSTLLSFVAIIYTILNIPDQYLFLVFLLYLSIYFISSFYIKDMVKFKIKKKRLQ